MKGYFELTRSLTYSLLFALPLLLLYELGTLLMSRADPNALRNGADVLLRSLLAAGGLTGTAGFTAFLVAIAVILVLLERRRKKVPVRLAPFAGMAAEREKAEMNAKKIDGVVAVTNNLKVASSASPDTKKY